MGAKKDGAKDTVSVSVQCRIAMSASRRNVLLQADEPLVCKQTKRSSASVPKEQKRKYAMCVSASSALRERLSNTHLSKTTQREEKNKKRRKRKHQARGNEVTVCHNLFERQDQVSRCRPETTMAAL